MKNVFSNQFIVYKVTSPSGKIYIGVTCEGLETRKHKHLYLSKNINENGKFQKAIRKYGIDNLVWEIVAENMNKNDALILESELISRFDTFRTGYNSTKGGDGAWGYVWNKHRFKTHQDRRKELYYSNVEWRKKRSEQTKQYYRNNPDKVTESRARINKARLSLTPDQKRKRIESVTSTLANLKRSLSRGCKFFHVYDFTEKRYMGTWLIKSLCVKELGLCNGKINSCLSGRRNHHKKYIFKYMDDPTVDGTKFNEIWLESITRRVNVTK